MSAFYTSPTTQETSHKSQITSFFRSYAPMRMVRRRQTTIYRHFIVNCTGLLRTAVRFQDTTYTAYAVVLTKYCGAVAIRPRRSECRHNNAVYISGSCRSTSDAIIKSLARSRASSQGKLQNYRPKGLPLLLSQGSG